MPSHAMIVGEAVSEHPGFRKQFLEQATTSFLVPAAEQPVTEQFIPVEEFDEVGCGAGGPIDNLIAPTE